MTKTYSIAKSALNYALCIINCALLCACSPHRAHPDNLEDFSETLYTPTDASGFSITGKEGSQSSLITVSNPWQGADSVATHLFITRAGDEAPLAYEGQVLDGEADRIAVTSSTHVAMLDALGAADRIVAVSGIDYINNPDVQRRRDDIADIGYEGNFDYEALLASDPDIVLLYGVNGASSMEGKLRELQIPYIYIGDYVEESPLGKAEWMVPIAEIIGEREKGADTYAAIAARYAALKKRVADSAVDAPSVMLNVPYGDSWFMPSADSYMARLIRDAGADYIYRKNTGNTSMPIDLEEAYTLASQADFWLNTDRMESLSTLAAKCPKFKDTRALRNGYVYNNTRRANSAGGNDFYESAVVNPDILLRDLAAIFHPELSSDTLVYYKKLK
ncbi:MAG: ABC transporter substrate-binding protein [Muribaculaceae bacterium]|nr:ABC transporter substrate-binding protein [Muribaculaceae bacterium]